MKKERKKKELPSFYYKWDCRGTSVTYVFISKLGEGDIYLIPKYSVLLVRILGVLFLIFNFHLPIKCSLMGFLLLVKILTLNWILLL